jgi:adenosylcobalamin-dependent ribonucleoside-triphosphate reductase
MAATADAGNKYRLPVPFVQKYAQRPVSFGFGDLGEFVYRRTYARQGEVWWQTVQRVVEGTMSMWLRELERLDNAPPMPQVRCLDYEQWYPDLPSKKEMREIAMDMYDRIFNFKFLPPGRGLWAMGTPITEERHNYTALNNCAFISTWSTTSERRYSYPFCFVFEASMLGVGCGFDTDGAGKIPLDRAGGSWQYGKHVVEDSREGWTQALRLLLDHFIYGDTYYGYDYSAIRPKGSPINGFGGVASGPEPLKWALDHIYEILARARHTDVRFMTSRNIVDIMNIVGKCVVSGNVRRTALIALGSHYDGEFLDLKNYEKNPERMAFGWTSNNSVVVQEAGRYVDYGAIAQRIYDNGEPGVVWLGNAQKFGRITLGQPSWQKKDPDVKGVNPCGEQTLEDGELCCLVEVFPCRCEDGNDIEKTLQLALLYAKIVSCGETLWPETNAIMRRNRRIGLSLSGITQYLKKLREDSSELMLPYDLNKWYNIVVNHDKKISKKWFGTTSKKLTTVKPSGTISLLAGATPGVHFPIARYYIRRVRVASDHELLPCLWEAGYTVVTDVFSATTAIVEFLVDSGVDETESTVTPERQLNLTALMQRCWSDNSVSVTIKFDREKITAERIAELLEEYQHRLKSVSMLPISRDVYPQMPYEEITKEEYEKRTALLKPVQWPQPGEGAPDAPMFCDADGCSV